MKRALIIAAALIVVVFAALSLREHVHYAKPGQTKVDLHFLGFTNTSAPTLRLARFAVSNMSPWSVVQLEYPTSETHRESGEDAKLVHSFVGGPKLWRAHEAGVTLVHVQKWEDQVRWRLIASYDRYEDPIVANLHKWRFFFRQYVPVKVPRWDHIDVVSEWISE